MSTGVKSALRRWPSVFGLLVLTHQVLRRWWRLLGVFTHPWFVRDAMRYRRLGGSWSFRHLHPRLYDKTAATPFDPHYFYQAAWAAGLIHRSGAESHYDVGSSVGYVGMLSAFTTVHFIDLRPLCAHLDNLTCIGGSILQLPLADRSVASLSCLHVAEHIGLGRYGDELDPQGLMKAARELQRVLAPRGALYFSLPVGAPRTEFNAHRVTCPRAVPGYFPELTLVGFAITDDADTFHADASLDGWETQKYACGMYHFTRKA